MSSIAGIVKDAGGKPVAGARVYITQGPGAVPDVAALTGADGSFTLAAGAAGRYRVGASHDTLGSAEGEIEVGARGAAAKLQLRFGR